MLHRKKRVVLNPQNLLEGKYICRLGKPIFLQVIVKTDSGTSEIRNARRNTNTSATHHQDLLA
jgi:hypothetical protein